MEPPGKRCVGELLLRLLFDHQSEVLYERPELRVLIGEEVRKILTVHVAHTQQELLHVREELRIARDALQACIDRREHRRGRAFWSEDSVPRVNQQIDALLLESGYLRIQVHAPLGCDAEYPQLPGIEQRLHRGDDIE